MTETIAIECPCFGSNENCFRCGGRGVISDGEIAAPERYVTEDLDDSPIARLAERASHGAKYPPVTNRPDPRTPLRLPERATRRPKSKRRGRCGTATERCPHCGNAMPAFAIAKHVDRKHRSAPARSSTPRSNTLASARSPSSYSAHPVGIARAERSIDGSRGFHSFAREHGRFGSHPSFDGDE